MRLLHVLHSLRDSAGGPLRATVQMVGRSALRADILGVGPIRIAGNPLAPERIHALVPGRPRAYGYSPDLRAWLRSHLEDYDGVVLYGMWLYPGWAAYCECIRSRTPYACFPRGMLEPWPVYGQGAWKAAKKLAYWWWRERRIFHHARHVFFTTQREQRRAATVFELNVPQSVLLPFGIDPSPAPVDAPDRADLVGLRALPYSLFLGRIHPKKNVEFLLRAWAQARVRPDWRLVVAGPGEPDYLRRLQQLVARLGIPEAVSFPGLVTGADKAFLYQHARWFLLPSQQENFAIAPLEAIERSCPVAVSDQVYVADSFHQASEVLPLKLRPWVEFLAERMCNQAWRQKVVDLDRLHIVPRFDIASVARAWDQAMLAAFS